MTRPALRAARLLRWDGLDDAEVVFENLGHDFPQRVIYRFVAPAQLRASIEGLRGGSLKRIEFPMVRVRRRAGCGAGGKVMASGPLPEPHSTGGAFCA